MKTYQILSTIRYKGKDLKSGLVTLDSEMATALLRSGHIMGPIDMQVDTQRDTQVPAEPSVGEDSPENAPTEATKPAARPRGRK